MDWFQAAFGTTGQVSWWQEGARAVVVLAYGLVILRIAGRRIFGKWSSLDSIVAVIVGSSLSRVVTGTASLGGTLFATTLLIALHWLLAHAAARWPGMALILEGKPIHLAHEGRTSAPTLVHQGVSQGDLDEALRKAGIEHARLVTLEPSGKITVVKKT